jgi:hypothetical protein
MIRSFLSFLKKISLFESTCGFSPFLLALCLFSPSIGLAQPTSQPTPPPKAAITIHQKPAQLAPSVQQGTLKAPIKKPPIRVNPQDGVIFRLRSSYMTSQPALRKPNRPLPHDPAVLTLARVHETLRKNEKALHNQTITLRGMIVRSLKHTTCTLMMCLPKFPCCNRCGEPLLLRDLQSNESIVLHGSVDGKEIGCYGNECVRQCQPMQPGQIYTLRGTLQPLSVYSRPPRPHLERYHFHVLSFQPWSRK